MANQRLTKRVVDAAQQSSHGDHFIWDTELSGFGLRISSGGVKSYVFQYRIKGRNARRMTIGGHGNPWTTETARREAERRLLQVRRGVDPVDEDKRLVLEAKERERSEAQAELRRRAFGFDTYADNFVQLYLKHHWVDSWKDGENILTTAARHFGEKPITEIKRADVVEWLDLYSDRPGMKKLIHSVLRKMFNWATDRGDLEYSPISGMKAPKTPAKRQRVLNQEELICVWLAAEKLGDLWGAYFRLLIATMQRREEVAAMDWSEIDMKEAVWQLPSYRSKNDRAHRVPLNALAIAELKKRSPQPSGLVFSTTGSTAVSGISKAKKRLDEEMLAVMEERAMRRGENFIAINLVPWRIHDLRRTGATNLQALGVPVEVTEAVLNHVSGSIGGVAGVYNLFRYEPQKHDAFEAWNKHLNSILVGH